LIVVPAIDLRSGGCVRLARGDPSQATDYGDNPLEVALRFEEAGARMLHVVDLDAAFGTGSNHQVVRSICAQASVPVQVGGGLRTPEAVAGILEAGAARAVLGTAAALDPGFVAEMVGRHRDRVVVAVDVRGGKAMVRGWQEQGPPVEDLIPALDHAGCPRYLVTSIAADGMLAGPDLRLYAQVRELTHAPVLASGGIRSAEDLRALATLGLEGAVVGKALYEGTLSLEEVAAEVNP
jgi:phosphoribosylanthranilate isomerase